MNWDKIGRDEVTEILIDPSYKLCEVFIYFDYNIEECNTHGSMLIGLHSTLRSNMSIFISEKFITYPDIQQDAFQEFFW